MTNEKLQARVEHLIDNAVVSMKGQSGPLIRAAAIDVEGEYDDSWWLAKSVLCALLRLEAEQWRHGGRKIPSADEEACMRAMVQSATWPMVGN